MVKDSMRENCQDTKEKLDKVSASFCLAKWHQVTLHLQNGNNHSCHHPNTHRPQLEELKNNPSALHNTKFKKNIRKMMLDGIRPKECEYCWKIEDTPGDHYSDRHIKSGDQWAKPFFDETLKIGEKGNVNPKYLEVSFGSSCNFKCSYCLPHISSSWMKELKQFGEYATVSRHHAYPEEDKMPIQDSENNPYLKSFWEWWPTLYSDLKVLRITGGEPLLLPDTFKVLDYVAANPNKNLDLAINTNLGVDQKFVDKAVKSIKKIQDSQSLKQITIYTSLDTWGSPAEYIRFGLEMNLFKSNLFHMLDSVPNLRIVFMCTYNLLSISKFRELLEFILEIKNKYKMAHNQYASRIILDISYLKDPHFMCANLADEGLLDRMRSDLNFMQAYADKHQRDGKIGFSDYEMNKMERLVGFCALGVAPDFKKVQITDLYKFFSEHDKRRNTSFENVFPEYVHLYDQGKVWAAP